MHLAEKRLVGSASGRREVSRFFTLLRPMDNGAQEIRSLDGLRAVAALSIVVFHALHAAGFQYNPINRVTGNVFWYLPTGVHLFFVLSGFLLFLPYARAILLNRTLPSARRFYRRRALRILPAYLVVLATLVLLRTAGDMARFPGASVLTHLLMIHDMFPAFNRDFEGPFWTLAVEVQFYLLLPLMAAGLAWFVGKSRSSRRLVGGLALLMALALGLRGLDIFVTNGLPAQTSNGFARAFVLATMGMQGKYLEVFLMGMLASVLYVVSVEFGALVPVRRQQTGWLFLPLAAALVLVAVPNVRFGGTIFAPGARWGANVLLYPLLVGAGYAALLLAILLGSRPVRWLFETPPVRFVGLISYSLYLWHDPIILAKIPVIAGLPLIARVTCAFPVAYLSYQLVERPFLKRRRRGDVPAPTTPPADTVPARAVLDDEPAAVVGS